MDGHSDIFWLNRNSPDTYVRFKGLEYNSVEHVVTI